MQEKDTCIEKSEENTEEQVECPIDKLKNGNVSGVDSLTGT